MLSFRDTPGGPSHDARRPGPVSAPCGTWASPITPRIVAASALRLGSVVLDGEDIYWIEGRPEEGGRNVIVKRSSDGRIADVTPARTNVRTRVHEYGGAAFNVYRGTIYYSEFADQRLYRLKPEPLQKVDAWLEPFRQFWSARVDALERHLDRMEKKKRKPGRKR